MSKTSDLVEVSAPNHARYLSATEQSTLSSKGSRDHSSISDNSKLRRRPRARQACLACRARKVRCDVCFSGVPCLNCKQDSQECVVKPRIRKWVAMQSLERQKSTEAGDCEGARDPSPAIVSPSHYLQDLIEDFVTPGDQPRATMGIDIAPTSNSLDAGSAKTCLSTTSPRREVIFMENEPEGSNDAICDLRQELSIMEGKCSETKAASSNSSTGFLLASFYRFVKLPIFTKMDPDAAQFLEKRGCLHLPAPPILKQIIQGYFLYFHPLVPLLVEQAFWEAYDRDDSPGRLAQVIPLFILQAMLFVSCPYVSLESLNTLGFRTVKEARAEFYSRAKTLFDLQIDLDDQARSQGALMLTYRTSEVNDRSATYWLSVSIHYAKNIKAYCYNEKPDQTERINLKRLWWCCVLRDRVLALALRQAPLISPEAFDFSHGGFVFGDFAHEVGSSRVYEAPVKKVLVQVAIVLCHLGMILNDIPLEAHSTTGRKKNQLCPDQIKALLSRLDNWYQTTYIEFRLASLSADAHDSIILFSNVVYTYYYAAKALLYNYILLSTVSSDDAISPNHDRTRLEAQKNLSRCFRSITENLMELENSGLVKYLPITFISFAATPFLWDLLQAQMLNSDDRTQSLQKDLKAHLDVMGGFNDLYENAESTVKCIKHIVEHVKTKESLPQRTDIAQGPPRTGLNNQTKSRDGGVITWKDFIIEDPQTYLRIVLTVEYSLAHGHCPSEADFPKPLRMPPYPAIDTSSWEALGSSVDTNWFSEAFDDIIINYSDSDA